MKELYLYTDESGVLNPQDIQGDLYALCGCVISPDKLNCIEAQAEAIKYKYWKKKSIVFHSAEIAKNLGPYSIFKGNPQLKNIFFQDLYNLLNTAPITIFPVFFNKKAARERKWGYEKSLVTVAREFFKNYILYTLSRNDYKGKIIIESSDPNKDLSYLKTFSYFSEQGVPKVGVTGEEVRRKITSLSFVNKHNGDIAEQLADLFAYAAICKYQSDILKKNFLKKSYKRKISSILNSKLYRIHPNTGKKKKIILKEINSFPIIP